MNETRCQFEDGKKIAVVVVKSVPIAHGRLPVHLQSVSEKDTLCSFT
jgi:hypothetical protein